MGKALVVNGLSVAESLGKVTFVRTVVVTSITLDKTTIAGLKVGNTEQLTATVTTEDWTPYPASWTSSNNNIATVSSTGLVTAKGVGTCTITAQAGNKKAVCTVQTAVNIDLYTEDYYAANSTISADEKSAYTELVSGMVADGTWNKIKYLYPMCGSSVDDMLIDAKHATSGSNLLVQVANTDGLLVKDRKLTIGNNPTAYKTLTAPPADLSLSDMSVIAAHETDGAYNMQTIALINTSTNRFELRASYGGDDKITLGLSNSVDMSTSSSLTSYTERIICACYKQGVGGKVYKDRELILEDSADNAIPSNNQLTRGYAFVSNATTDSDALNTCSFLAVSGYIEASDWGKIYDRVLAFLKRLGRHS